MAEPVIVPVRLEVTDLDTTNVSWTDAEAQISKSMSKMKQHINNVFKEIDPSVVNKNIEASMKAVTQSVRAAEDAQLRFNEAITQAGKSSASYKAKAQSLKTEIKETTEQIAYLERFLNTNAARKNPGVSNTATIELENERKRLEKLQSKLNKLNPADYIADAAPIQLEKVANAYNKVLSAQENVNVQSNKFNKTIKDNRLTDEYKEYIKQANEYKEKLEALDEKSRRMETLGATDKQWEALRYDTAQVSSEMDSLLRKMREAVKSGEAFRFGNKEDSAVLEMALKYQNKSLNSSRTNRKRNIETRADNNQNSYTEEYQEALNELEKLEKKVESLKEKSARMFELGATDAQFARMAYDATVLDEKIGKAQTHLAQVVAEGKAFKFGNGDIDTEMGKISTKANALKTNLSGIVTDAKQAQGGLVALGTTNPKLAAILTVATKIGQGFSKVGKVISTVAKTAATKFAGVLKVIGNVASRIGKLGSGVTRFTKGIISATKHMNIFGKTGSKSSSSMNKGFNKLTKNVLMFGFGFRTAYYAVKRLRNIFIEGFKAMGNQFEDFGKPMQELINSFTRLKASLATAFQPLVSVVMPILTKVMGYLTTMLEAIGKFNAALTGQGHIYKAVAKDIESVGDSAKDTNNQLGSYDKLEVINKPDSGFEYEQQEIGETENAVSKFAQMVKEAWEKADFTGVGQYVTEQLLKVLERVETNIIPKVTEFVNRLLMSINTFLTGFDASAIGNSIGSIINTIVSGVDWSQVGALFGNLYQTIWDFTDGIINGIDWASVGQALATAVNSLFSTISLEDIGTTINTLFNSIWTLIGNFFATVDFETIATGIANGINNIFSGGSEAFNAAIPNVANGIVTFFTTAIETIDWESIKETLSSAVHTILQSLGEAMESSDNPVIAAFGKVVTALDEAITILEPAINAIIGAISPIIESILPVISELLPPITEIISTAVQMALPVIVSLVKELSPVLTKLIQTILPVLKQILTDFQPLFDVLTETVLPVIAELLDAVMPLLGSILDLTRELMAPTVELIAPLLDLVFTILDPLIDILKPIFDILGSFCDILTVALAPILDSSISKLNGLTLVFELLEPVISALAWPLDLIAMTFDYVAGVAEDILGPAIWWLIDPIGALMGSTDELSAAFDDSFQAIKDVVHGMYNAIKPYINSFISGIESMANGLVSGINVMIRALNKLSVDFPDWPVFGDMAGQKFGFNIKEVSKVKIPRLAQGAVIPPNKEFLAMLGDQKRGTNIEAPLDTIKQALAEVLAEVGGGSREPIVLQVNGRALAKVVWDEQEKRYKQTGKYSMA